MNQHVFVLSGLKCISLHVYYLVNATGPDVSQQLPAAQWVSSDNSQPLLQLLSQGGQVEQVTEGGVELASEDKEQESDAKVSGFAKYFCS